MSCDRLTDGLWCVWHVGVWRMGELVENDRIVDLGGSFDEFCDEKCCGYAQPPGHRYAMIMF
jgi:hypothetical protein